MSTSIIIPTLNRERSLARTLESVARHSQGRKDYEVLVVDNASTDGTATVVRALQGAFPHCPIRYIHEPVPGLLSGRHRGAREAQGDILAYLDDDVLLAPTWWEGLDDAFRDPEVVLAGGPSLPEFAVPPPVWLPGLWDERAGAKRLDSLSLIDQGPEVKPCDPTDIWGLNYVIRRATLYDCRGFHPDGVPTALLHYRGDGESGLSLKIHQAGKRAQYHPLMAVTHLIPTSRLTVAAFAQRGFYGGVSTSYTRIRRERRVGPGSTPSWRTPFRRFKRFLEEKRVLTRPDTASVRQWIQRASFEGRRWHEEQVRSNPELLAWVLKADYFDYRLPSLPDS